MVEPGCDSTPRPTRTAMTVTPPLQWATPGATSSGQNMGAPYGAASKCRTARPSRGASDAPDWS